MSSVTIMTTVCGEVKPSRFSSGLNTSTSVRLGARVRPSSRWRSAAAREHVRLALREIFFADAAEVGAQEAAAQLRATCPRRACARRRRCAR